ncbi:MAG: monovalent cation/H+ antiporter subunit D family protein [Rhodospirillaceae bacterium]|nr:monovalent cation/H+ antiporter subunit D family protein [Rhodospirillaceae bacterium]
MIAEQNIFLILLVIIPLMAAPVCVLARNANVAWSISMAVAWAVLGIAIKLVIDLSTLDKVLYYRIGGWDAPWGIEYALDKVGGLVILVVASIGALALTYAKRSVEKEITAERIYLFYAMLMLCLSGLLGIAITGDAFNLFVFLEISSLSSYVLISLGKDKRALTSAFNYLIMGTIGATFYIIGVGMMYMMTGTLNIADLSSILPAVADTRTILVALAFLTVGISLKLALFPLHMWLPGAYAFAPSVVTVFLAATATKVSLYVLIRIFFTMFGQVDVFETFPLQPVLMAMALAAMFVASLAAIWQQNIKRMLAYSSIAQVGYMVLGVAIATEAGLAGGIIHIFNHALMKGALFMAVGAMAFSAGITTINEMAGMGKRMPLVMAAFVVGGLSLIGVPLTVGFVSKWALVSAALDTGMWPLAALILLSSLLAVIYVWRVVEIAYMRPAPENSPQPTPVPFSMLAPTWVLALASIWFGVNATYTMEMAHSAARHLMGGF